MVKLSLIAQLRYYLLAGIRPARREWVFVYPLSRRRRSSLYLELLPGWVGGIKTCLFHCGELQLLKNSTDSYQWRALTHQWQTVVCLLPTSATTSVRQRQTQLPLPVSRRLVNDRHELTSAANEVNVEG